MENSTTLQKSPYKVIVEKDKTYFWCACSLSQKQPFCDGAHKKDGKFLSKRFLIKLIKKGKSFSSTLFSYKVRINLPFSV